MKNWLKKMAAKVREFMDEAGNGFMMTNGEAF